MSKLTLNQLVSFLSKDKPNEKILKPVYTEPLPTYRATNEKKQEDKISKPQNMSKLNGKKHENKIINSSDEDSDSNEQTKNIKNNQKQDMVKDQHTENNTKSTKENIIKDQKMETKLTKNKKKYFPKMLDEIFGEFAFNFVIEKFYKTGEVPINISLYSSVLHCLDQSFMFKNIDEQFECITSFVLKMCYDIHNDKLIHKYNYHKLDKITIKDAIANLLSDINNYRNTNQVLRFLSDYFNINIFVLLLQTDQIFCIYGENKYNKYKKNIIISKNDTVFEPIFHEHGSYFTFEHKLISNLIEKYQKNISIFDSTKLFMVRDDDELNQEQTNMPKYSDKMKLAELQKLATNVSINIKINNKNKTKIQLIHDLNKHYL